MKIHMLIRWYERKPDFSPDYSREHHGTIIGETPDECMKQYRELSWNHDCVKYTQTEIEMIY